MTTRKELVAEVKTLIDRVSGLKLEDFSELKLPEEFKEFEFVQITNRVDYSNHFEWQDHSTSIVDSNERKRVSNDHNGTKLTVRSYNRTEYVDKRLKDILDDIIMELDLKHLWPMGIVKIPFVRLVSNGDNLRDLCKEEFSITETLDYSPVIRIPPTIVDLRDTLIKD